MRIRRMAAAAGLILIVCFSFAGTRTARHHRAGIPPYKNPKLSIEQRVQDLVSRMTLEEKASQMMNSAAAIDRLGIPQYDWWNEGLHGVARAGYATVFPQAIGLAATWDPDLIHQVADVISTEARAKNNEFVRNGQRARYEGLTFWSPNINIFRDPRWGRGQETYGEDPYLTSRLAVAFVRGLQGDDPRYLKVVATPKHYAVHSGPEPERHGFNAVVDERDLRETYLPAFRAAVVEAKAESVMCAYNRTDGQPCCANTRLLTDILRGEWDFKGYVVSDCGAIDDIYRRHGYAKSEPEAAAAAVKAGTDLSCGREYSNLVQAVRDGLITEAEIDTALKRLLTARFRLGMFDPPDMVPYQRIPFSENDSAEHRRLALEAARKSVALLKNSGGALPLGRGIKSIAVIGPNADAPEGLLGNYNGQPSRSVTPLQGIRQAAGRDLRVTYALGCTLSGQPGAPIPDKALAVNASAGGSGLEGAYFSNKDLQGDASLSRIDAQVNFDWGRWKPAPALKDGPFSVRWNGRLTAPESGSYQIGVTADGGFRLWVDGKVLIDAWSPAPARTILKPLDLEAGHPVDVRLEYYHGQIGNAVVRLVWAVPNGKRKMIDEAVAAARASDRVVMVLGIAPSLEGEEMNVNIPGFKGGDRTSLDLPEAQQDLLKAVDATGKPIVLVLLNGSALAVNWAQQNVPAIVEAWYPGEEGGTALADVLFGRYNPAGRLPVTFYKSVDQLPPFEDYSMKGRTYRYFKGAPLYPFGFGLSYTRFAYSNETVSRRAVPAGQSVTVSATVRNVGRRSGEEVVELYVTHEHASVPVPIRSLAGIKRILLKPRESQVVKFTISPEQLSVIDDQGRRVVEPGRFVVSVGGEQPGFTGAANAATTGAVAVAFSVTGKAQVLP